MNPPVMQGGRRTRSRLRAAAAVSGIVAVAALSATAPAGAAPVRPTGAAHATTVAKSPAGTSMNRMTGSGNRARHRMAKAPRRTTMAKAPGRTTMAPTAFVTAKTKQMKGQKATGKSSRHPSGRMQRGTGRMTV